MFYSLKNREIIESSKIFDIRKYLDNNKDLKDSGMDVVEHYLRHGFNEERYTIDDAVKNEILNEYPELKYFKIPYVLYYENNKKYDKKKFVDIVNVEFIKLFEDQLNISGWYYSKITSNKVTLIINGKKVDTINNENREDVKNHLLNSGISANENTGFKISYKHNQPIVSFKLIDSKSKKIIKIVDEKCYELLLGNKINSNYIVDTLKKEYKRINVRNLFKLGSYSKIIEKIRENKYVFDSKRQVDHTKKNKSLGSLYK